MYNRVKRVRRGEAKLFGVCGGLSKYLDPEMDPFIVRLIFTLLTIFSPPLMILLYFILALVLKLEKPKEEPEKESEKKSEEEPKDEI